MKFRLQDSKGGASTNDLEAGPKGRQPPAGRRCPAGFFPGLAVPPITKSPRRTAQRFVSTLRLDAHVLDIVRHHPLQPVFLFFRELNLGL